MNVCSLLPKIDLVELELSNNDIILLSETHLNDDIVDGDICASLMSDLKSMNNLVIGVKYKHVK
jgi:hypothetical protein